MSPQAAFWLQASITVSFLAGSSAPTALYPVYQAAWGFSPITVTLVFAVYAVAVLASLLVAGRLSDHIGRRPVLIVSTLAQAAAMLVLAAADGVAGLSIGRILQGLSTGAAVAAVGAGLVDLDKVHGTTANAVAPILGTAVGALAAGLTVRFLPAPTHLVYLAFGAMFILQCVGVVLMDESVTRRAVSTASSRTSRLMSLLASMKPRFALPAGVRGPMWRAAPVLVAAWALAGFYASLGPSLVRSLFGFDSSLGGGLTLCLLAGSGAMAVLMLQRRAARGVLSAGAWALLIGTATVFASTWQRSAPLFFTGTAIAGFGFGAGFQGAIRSVVPLAATSERAGVLSVAFVIAYLAMGVPAVVAGALVAQGGGILLTAREFGGFVMALAALALGLEARPGFGSRISGTADSATAGSATACSTTAGQARASPGCVLFRDGNSAATMPSNGR